jgi:hypothetical protein
MHRALASDVRLKGARGMGTIGTTGTVGGSGGMEDVRSFDNRV